MPSQIQLYPKPDSAPFSLYAILFDPPLTQHEATTDWQRTFRGGVVDEPALFWATRRPARDMGMTCAGRLSFLALAVCGGDDGRRLPLFHRLHCRRVQRLGSLDEKPLPASSLTRNSRNSRHRATWWPAIMGALVGNSCQLRSVSCLVLLV